MNPPTPTSAHDPPNDDELLDIREAVAGLAAIFAPRAFNGIPAETINGYALGLRRYGAQAVRAAAADLALSADAFPALAQFAELARAHARRAADQREYLSPEAAVARAEAELRERARKAREATPKLPAPTEDPVSLARRGVRALEDRGDDPPLDPGWRERVRQAIGRDVRPVQKTLELFAKRRKDPPQEEPTP